MIECRFGTVSWFSVCSSPGSLGYWALLTTPIDAIRTSANNRSLSFRTGRTLAEEWRPDHVSADGEPAGPARRAPLSLSSSAFGFR